MGAVDRHFTLSPRRWRAPFNKKGAFLQKRNGGLEVGCQGWSA